MSRIAWKKLSTRNLPRESQPEKAGPKASGPSPIPAGQFLPGLSQVVGFILGGDKNPESFCSSAAHCPANRKKRPQPALR
jgi:hypothetical protein